MIHNVYSFEYNESNRDREILDLFVCISLSRFLIQNWRNNFYRVIYHGDL